MNPATTEVAAFADFLSEFFAARGLQQHGMAKRIKRERACRPADHYRLDTVSESTLSRIRRGEIKRMPRREKFNMIVLTGLHIAWTTAGKHGPAPGFHDVERIWEEWQEFRKKALAASGRVPGTEPAPSVPPPADTSRTSTDLSDVEQLRYGNAYGGVGVILLSAARSSERRAALVLGVLRVLDGHHKEGADWLRSASSLGSAPADDLLRISAPAERRQAAVEQALELASSPRSGSSAEESVLLLERAARSGSRKAAGLLAAHYDSLGEVGHATRWSRVAAQVG
ncbi:hypothetical protein ACFWGT_26155 [Nocardiopsis sp. NPDC060348]|uniref:hypothetical protein n=1 Tax=Nocardiopsis sp. NPDC060348 TaxID=3347102 RepID=UPI0011612B99